MAAVPSRGRKNGELAPEVVATREFYERYASQVFSFCLHRLGSREEAEDAVQSTFLNAFRGLKRGIVPQAEAPWLFAIAQNVCLSRRRSSRRRYRIESPADFDLVQEIASAPSQRGDELIGLQDALERMPDRQRRAILLREWQGLSYHEIAGELGVSHAAVETLIFRARRSLAKGLERPAVSLRRRVRRSADLGNVFAALQSLLTGGGAAAKVAATVVVSATGIAAAVPVTRHLHLQPAPRHAAATSAAPAGRTLAGPLPTLSRDGSAGAWEGAAARLDTSTVAPVASTLAAAAGTAAAPAPEASVVELTTQPPAGTTTPAEPAAAPSDPAPAPAPATSGPATTSDPAQTTTASVSTTAGTTAAGTTTAATTSTRSTETTTTAATTSASTQPLSTAALETTAPTTTAQVTTTASTTAPGTTIAATTRTGKGHTSTSPPGQVETVTGVKPGRPGRGG